MGRTERPEQVQAPALRSIIRMIDMAIENGSLDASDRDEVIQMFISGPTTVVDNKAGGGMMNMDEMIRPLGYAAGGPIPRNEFDALMAEFDTPENRAGPGEPTGIEKIIADKYPVDPRHTLPANFPVDDKFLTREIGGDIGRDELEGLLKSLNISLMLAQESFLGGSNSEKIRDLEKQIREIELMLGEE